MAHVKLHKKIRNTYRQTKKQWLNEKYAEIEIIFQMIKVKSFNIFQMIKVKII